VTRSFLKISDIIALVAVFLAALVFVLAPPTKATVSVESKQTVSSTLTRQKIALRLRIATPGDPYLRITPASCVFSVIAGGSVVDDPQIPFCEDRRGRTLFVPALTNAKVVDLELEIARNGSDRVDCTAERSPWKVLSLAVLLLLACVFGALRVSAGIFRLGQRCKGLCDLIICAGRSALVVILGLWTALFYQQGGSGVYLAGVMLFDCFVIWLLFRKEGLKQSSVYPQISPNSAMRVTLFQVAVSVCVVLGSISSIRHYNLESRAFDLAIQENVIWNSINGNPFISSVMNGIPYLGNHTVFAYILLLPLYYLIPSTYTLLWVQAIVVVATVMPLFLVGRYLLKSECAAALICISFLIHPGILGAATNDFHELALAPCALAWVVFAVVFQRPLLLAGMTLIASCIKEDMSLNLMVLGGGLLFTRHATHGVYLLICGTVSYVLWQNVVIPTFAGFESSYTWYLTKSLGTGVAPSEVVHRILAGPFGLVAPLVDQDRIFFLIQTLGAFLFIPCLALRGVAMTSYGLALVLLSGHPPLYTLGYHYIFPWLTLATFAYLFVAGDFQRGWLRNLSTVGVFSAHLALFVFFGPVYPRDLFRYGPVATKNPFVSRTAPELVSAAEWAKSVIPGEASVVTTETLAAHFSTRERVVVGNRTRSAVTETFDYCLGERINAATSCRAVGCLGEEVAGPFSALLVCRQKLP